jgi:hypothetical protein
LGFDVEQAEPCLCGRMKSALYLALPQRQAFLLLPRLVAEKGCSLLIDVFRCSLWILLQFFVTAVVQY